MQDFAALQAEEKKVAQRRLRQSGMLPTIIKPRSLGDLVLSTETATGISPALDNGDEYTFVITISNSAGAKIFANLDISLYIGSVADANELPGGSGVTESDWQVIGPINSWGQTNNKNQVVQIYVRNISAGAGQTIILKTIARFITNNTPGGGSSA